MFLLAFVNRVRGAQAREPLQMLEIGDLTALEEAMQCRLERDRMRFGDRDTAGAVASRTGLRVDRRLRAVELPHAIRSYVDRCAPG
jgi:hypothetical protein